MIKVISTIAAVLIIASLIWGGVQYSAKRELRKTIAELNTTHQREVDYLNAKFDSCLLSKSKTDTIWDTVSKYLGWKYKEKDLTAEDSLKIYEYILVNTNTGDTNDIFLVGYADTLKTEDFELYWYAKVFGHIEELGFPGYKLYTEKIVENWVINHPPPPIDPVVKYKFFKGPYVRGAITSTTDKILSVRGGEGTIGWMTRKGVMFGAGYQYLTIPHNGETIKQNLIKAEMIYVFGL